MIKNDNMQSRMTVLQMENVRLTNEIARLNGYVSFVEEENRNIERETSEECQQEFGMTLMDEEAFKRFLYDGHLDMHNIAIERCFRHIAIGRRNWLHTGSHQAAKNIAFMFGLLESCKLNDIDFGIYIEDVLTRIMYGEHVDESFLPCGYVPRYKEGQDAA